MSERLGVALINISVNALSLTCLICALILIILGHVGFPIAFLVLAVFGAQPTRSS